MHRDSTHTDYIVMRNVVIVRYNGAIHKFASCVTPREAYIKAGADKGYPMYLNVEFSVQLLFLTSTTPKLNRAKY